MPILDDFKAVLAHTSPNILLRIELGSGGAIFEFPASDLMAALGVTPAPILRVRVISPRLNIRSAPSLSGDIVGQYLQDAVIELEDEPPTDADAHQWARTRDGQGWVALDRTEPVSALGLPEIAPTFESPLSMAANWLPFTAAQRGAGLSAGGWAPAMRQLELVERNHIQLALLCAYQSGQAARTIAPMRSRGVQAFILRACISEPVTTSGRFTQLTLPILREYAVELNSAAQSPLLIAIHNEPNLTQEGWGVWQDGTGFADWWRAVAAVYRAEFPGVRLGFPALSPGGDVPGIRLAEAKFLAGCTQAIDEADWIGVHYYWTQSDGSDINLPVAEWRATFGGKPIIGTEVGPADANHVTAGAVLRAYAAFQAAGIPACAWLLDGTGAWKNADWTVHNIQL